MIKNQNVKVDLHVHSFDSADCNIKPKDIEKVLSEKKLDIMAVTDHNIIRTAFSLQEQWGDRIIVGEEIMTQEGEVIGLFLKKEIKKGFDIIKTVDMIKEQNGIVLIPHPFDLLRSGVGDSVQKVIKFVDIIEVFNGRTVVDKFNNKALEFSIKNKIFGVSCSDAHVVGEIGRNYVEIKPFLGRFELLKSLECPNLKLIKKRTTLGYRAQTTLYKIKKRFIKS